MFTQLVKPIRYLLSKNKRDREGEANEDHAAPSPRISTFDSEQALSGALRSSSHHSQSSSDDSFFLNHQNRNSTGGSGRKSEPNNSAGGSSSHRGTSSTNSSSVASSFDVHYYPHSVSTVVITPLRVAAKKQRRRPENFYLETIKKNNKQNDSDSCVGTGASSWANSNTNTNTGLISTVADAHDSERSNNSAMTSREATPTRTPTVGGGGQQSSRIATAAPSPNNTNTRAFNTPLGTSRYSHHDGVGLTPASPLEASLRSSVCKDPRRYEVATTSRLSDVAHTGEISANSKCDETRINSDRARGHTHTRNSSDDQSRRVLLTPLCPVSDFSSELVRTGHPNIRPASSRSGGETATSTSSYMHLLSSPTAGGPFERPSTKAQQSRSAHGHKAQAELANNFSVTRSATHSNRGISAGQGPLMSSSDKAYAKSESLQSYLRGGRDLNAVKQDKDKNHRSETNVSVYAVSSKPSSASPKFVESESYLSPMYSPFQNPAAQSLLAFSGMMGSSANSDNKTTVATTKGSNSGTTTTTKPRGLSTEDSRSGAAYGSHQQQHRQLVFSQSSTQANIVQSRKSVVFVDPESKRSALTPRSNYQLAAHKKTNSGSSSDDDGDEPEEITTQDMESILAVANATRLLRKLSSSSSSSSGSTFNSGRAALVSSGGGGGAAAAAAAGIPPASVSAVAIEDGVTVSLAPRVRTLSYRAGAAYPRSEKERELGAATSFLTNAGVKRAVTEVTDEEVGATWGALRRLIHKMVADIVVPLCPVVPGVTRRIAANRPAAVPIPFDDADERLVASMVTKAPNAYVVDDPATGYQIRRQELETCNGTTWLNDQVINYYCKLVSTQISGVCCLGTFFFTKLDSSDREGAHRWVKRQPVFNSRIVLIVINRHQHWTLCAVDNVRGTITYYDSLGGAGEDVMALTAAFLDEAFERKFGTSADKRVVADEGGADSHAHLKYVDFKRISPKKTVPQQKNAHDCGVFTTQFCLYAALSLKMNFKQEDIPYLRRLIVVELLSKKLMLRL